VAVKGFVVLFGFSDYKRFCWNINLAPQATQSPRDIAADAREAAR
jgi:hypothetical protein